MLSRFFPDYRADAEHDVLDRWKAGNLTLANEQDTRGYLRAMAELENVSLDAIVQYYGVADEFAERMRRVKA